MDSDEFRKWRRARYRTQEEAAEAFGVNFTTISRWERGDGYPTGRLLELACAGLDRERQEKGLAV